jgi:hypothetical protein
MTEDCRQAFEEWAADVRPMSSLRWPFERRWNGEYDCSTTSLTWQAWQAAWNRRASIPAPEVREEVRGLVEAAKAILACQHFDGVSPLYWVATSSKGDGLNEVAPKLEQALAALEAGHE